MLNNNLLKTMVFIAGLVATQVNASLITNGSFEDAPDSKSLTFGTDPANGAQPSIEFNELVGLGEGLSWAVFSGLPGWQVGYGPGIKVHASGTLNKGDAGVDNQAPDRKHYVELDTHHNDDTPGFSNAGIFQIVKNLKIGQTYELSFWYRARDTEKDNNTMNVYWLPTLSFLRSDFSSTYDYNEKHNNHVNWVNYKQRLTATSSHMVLGFGAAGDRGYKDGNKNGAMLDMVNLVEVSAPGTLALFGLAGLALVARRRKY